ncbi:hypothetical protein B0H16DRAFT_1476098 [Mycena metata]|uniref:Uncharacterized protein n=1 Tax=Mycena metata TaxID=1033252 RepID=A0AAD7HC90_9AGAR|nr:hypothetical protein B0H16DRAFT_1476098 [Mycena metata]
MLPAPSYDNAVLEHRTILVIHICFVTSYGYLLDLFQLAPILFWHLDGRQEGSKPILDAHVVDDKLRTSEIVSGRFLPTDGLSHFFPTTPAEVALAWDLSMPIWTAWYHYTFGDRRDIRIIVGKELRSKDGCPGLYGNLSAGSVVAITAPTECPARFQRPLSFRAANPDLYTVCNDRFEFNKDETGGEMEKESGILEAEYERVEVGVCVKVERDDSGEVREKPGPGTVGGDEVRGGGVWEASRSEKVSVGECCVWESYFAEGRRIPKNGDGIQRTRAITRHRKVAKDGEVGAHRAKGLAIGCFIYSFSTPTRASTFASILGKLGQKLGHEIGVEGGIVHKTTTCYPDFYPNFCPNSVPQLRLIGDLGHPSSRFGA